MDVPETLYARSGDVNIAYQTVGDGKLDLVYVPGWTSNVEYMWTYPPFVSIHCKLSSIGVPTRATDLVRPPRRSIEPAAGAFSRATFPNTGPGSCSVA